LGVGGRRKRRKRRRKGRRMGTRRDAEGERKPKLLGEIKRNQLVFLRVSKKSRM
jgi:hypothetical protein